MIFEDTVINHEGQTVAFNEPKELAIHEARLEGHNGSVHVFLPDFRRYQFALVACYKSGRESEPVLIETRSMVTPAMCDSVLKTLSFVPSANGASLVWNNKWHVSADVVVEYAFNGKTYNQTFSTDSAEAVVGGLPVGALTIEAYVKTPTVRSTYRDIYNVNVRLENVFSVKSEINSAEKEWTIDWDVSVPNREYIAVEVEYDKIDGAKGVVLTPIAEEKTVITDAKPCKSYRYRTVYLHPDEIPVDYAPYSSVRNIPGYKLSTTGWVIHADSWAPNEGTTSDGNGSVGAIPSKLFDNNYASYWHSSYNSLGQVSDGVTWPANGEVPYPHWVYAELGKSLTVERITLTARLTSFTAGFKVFEVQGSNDGVNWTSYGKYRFIAEKANYQETYLVRESDTNKPPSIRFFRLYFPKSDSNNNGEEGSHFYAHLAECEVYGDE
jgi:hypothetical protein